MSTEPVTFVLNAVNYTKSAFDQVKGSLGGLGAQVTTISGLFTAFSTGAVAAAIKSSADMADEMGKTAQKVGLTTEAFSGLAYAGKLADVSREQLSAGLRALSKNMFDTQAGTGEALEAFRALGIQVQGAGGQMRLTDQVFGDLADKFAGMADGAGKTALAMRLFGKSGADLIPLLNEGRAGIAAATEEARRFGLIVSDETAKAAQELNDNLARLGAVAEGVKFEFARTIIPAVTTLSAEMLKGIQIAGGFWEALGLFGTINPFRSIGGNLNQLRTDLESLEKGLAKRIERGWDAAPFEAKIADVKKQIEFLKFQQQAAALALATPDTLDARDLMARAGGAVKKLQAPALQGTEVLKDAMFRAQKAVELEELAAADSREAWQFYTDGRIAQEKSIEAARQLGLQAWFESIDHEQQVLMEAGAVELQIAAEHQRQLAAIEASGIQSRMDWERATGRQRARSIFGDLASITAGVAQHNKVLFELNKVAGIANAVIHAYEGITLTMAKYPYPINIGMAAAHAAAAFAQVTAIRSTSFSGGGGGSAPSVAGTTPAQPVSPVPAAPVADSRPTQVTIFQLPHGFDPKALYTGEHMFDLLEAVAEATRNGGRLVIADRD